MAPVFLYCFVYWNITWIIGNLEIIFEGIQLPLKNILGIEIKYSEGSNSWNVGFSQDCVYMPEPKIILEFSLINCPWFFWKKFCMNLKSKICFPWFPRPFIWTHSLVKEEAAMWQISTFFRSNFWKKKFFI